MPKSRKNPPRKTTMCRDCRGTGYVDRFNTRPCKKCNRTGIIPEPKRSR